MSTYSEYETNSVEYFCSSCKGNKWRIILVSEDNKVKLLISCSNPECVNGKLEDLDVDGYSSPFVVWDEFDITGQGYDEIVKKYIEPIVLN